MPVELAGLVPGHTTADEVEVIAKTWPEMTMSKDTKFGGEMTSAHNGYPAIQFHGEGHDVATIDLGGTLRIARVTVATTRPCAAIFAELGVAVKPAGCGGNRRPDPDEQRACTMTPDGKSKVAVSCRDANELDLQVEMPSGTYGR